MLNGVGWKEDVPELREGGGEFDGNQRAFGIELGRTHDVRFDFFLGLGIFDGELGAVGQALGQDDHGAIGADGVGDTVKRVGFARDVHEHGHPEEDTLGATALFIGLGSHGIGAAFDLRSVGLRRSGGRGDGGLLRRRHSSNPQKSRSGATNSMPYSQFWPC